MSNIYGGFVTSSKNIRNAKKIKYWRNSWGVPVIQIDRNHWVHAFGRKFAR